MNPARLATLCAAALVAGACTFEFTNPAATLAAGEIRGRVLQGGAQIFVRGTNIAAPVGTDGVFTLSGMPPGEYTLVIRAGAQWGVKAGVKLAPADGVDVGEIALAAAGSARLTVNVPRAYQATTFAAVPGTPVFTALARPGILELSGIPPGARAIVVWEPGFKVARASVTIAPGETVQGGTIELSAFDPAARGVVSGAVVLAGPRAAVTLHLVEAAVTQELPGAGSFAMDGVPEGIHTLRVSATGYREVYLTHVVSDPAVEATAVGQITLFPTGDGEDCDKDGLANTADDDDDNDGSLDTDEGGCACHHGPGVSQTCFGLARCRPIAGAVPVAVPGCDVLATPVGSRVVLDGSRSFRPGGGAIGYAWSIIGPGPGAEDLLGPLDEARLEFRPRVAGTFEVRLVASEAHEGSDPWLSSVPVVTRVHVDSSNAPPQWNTGVVVGAVRIHDLLARASPDALSIPEAVDGEGQIAAYVWVPAADALDTHRNALSAPFVAGENTRAPRMAYKPAVDTYAWAVYAIDERGAFSEPLLVRATFLEDEVQSSVFVDPYTPRVGGGQPCTCVSGGAGTLADPYCRLEDALAATAPIGNRKDIYMLFGCYSSLDNQPVSQLVSTPVECLEGRSLYGGFRKEMQIQGTPLVRDLGAVRIAVAASAAATSSTLECTGAISAATVIDGMIFRAPAAGLRPDAACGEVQTALIADGAAPTLSRNEIEAPDDAMTDVAALRIKRASPLLLNNVIRGGRALGTLAGVHLADGSSSILAHNLIDLSSSSGGANGSVAVAVSHVACNARLHSGASSLGNRCAVTCANNRNVSCSSDAECRVPSRPTLLNNVIHVTVGGIGRYGFVEGGAGSAALALLGNLVHIDKSGGAGAAYVDGGTNLFPPGFGGGTFVDSAAEVNALPEARGSASNHLEDPQLGQDIFDSNPYCPASPARDRAVPTALGVTVDFRGYTRPDRKTGKSDIGVCEYQAR